MSKRTKKILALLVATSMALSVAGCGAEKTTSEETGDTTVTSEEVVADSGEREHATITMYTDNTTPDYAVEDTVIGQKILENTNVDLEIEYLVDDEDTKEGLLLAGGELPDLVSTRDISKFIDAGAVIPLDDLIEKYGEDLVKVYGEDLEYLRAEDGHIYGISNSRGLAPWSKQPGKAMYIQQAVLKEFDYPEITTMDEYFDIIKKYQDKYPEITTMDEYFDIIKKYQDKYPEINGQPTIGFTVLSDDWRFGMCINGPIKFMNGYPDDGAVLVDQAEDGTYTSRLLYDSEEAKTYFTALNEMYLGGYFDESSFTSNYDQYQEKIAQGRVLGFHDQYWEIEAVNAALSTTEPERMYVGLPIVVEEGTKEYYNQPTPIESSKSIMISTSCEDPERVFQFLNDLCKEENQKLNFWGEAGVEYTVEEDGSFTFTDEQIALWQDDAYLRERGVKSFDYPFPVISNLQYYEDGNCGRPNGDIEFMKASYTDLDNELCEAYGWETLQSAFTYEETAEYGMAWSMYPANNGNDDAAYALQCADDALYTYVPKLVFAESGQFDSIWEEFKGKIADIEIQSYTDFIDGKIVERIEANNPSLQ